MRIFWPAILLLVFFTNACDNYNYISDYQQQSFIKFYGGDMEDEGRKVISTETGYLIMGNIKNPGRGMDICIILTDKFGNTTSSIKAYGGSFDDYGASIEVNSDGYIIVGSTITEQGDKQAYLVQISATGDTLWTKSYGYEYDDEAYDVLVRGNGNLVLCGYSEVTEIDKNVLFIETNAQGYLINMSRRAGSVTESEVAVSLVQAGKKYLMAGYSYGSSETNRELLAIHWDGSASPALVEILPVGLRSQVSSICTDVNNNYYLACKVQPDQSEETIIYLIKLNSNLGDEWQKSYSDQTRIDISDITIVDENILINGTSSALAGPTFEDFAGDMFFMKMDLSGENATYKYVGDGSSYHGNGIDVTSDGGYILTGANHINTLNSVITLCKLTPEGMLE